jgi:hypothetical protein
LSELNRHLMEAGGKRRQQQQMNGFRAGWNVLPWENCFSLTTASRKTIKIMIYN